MKEKQLFDQILNRVSDTGGLVDTGTCQFRIRKMLQTKILVYSDKYHTKTIGAVNTATSEYFFPLENILELLKNCHIALYSNKIAYENC